MITDTHCHLYDDRLVDDLEGCLERAAAADVGRMVVVGTDVASSHQAFELCADRPNLFPTAGIHPSDATTSGPEVRAEIERLCAKPECVGVGETGLDYFRGSETRDAQLDNFRWHLDLACRLDKPIVIHCRDAHEDTAALVSECSGLRGVMHCYTMGPQELEPYLAAGLHISFSGVVTYPKNEANREAARRVPEERLLVETDSPFLSPQGLRGQRNEPANVARILECVADARGLATAELAARTTANATALFGLS